MGYLNQAATELTAAMEREKEGEFSSAIRGYRTAVDILITGVQGEKMFSNNPIMFPKYESKTKAAVVHICGTFCVIESSPPITIWHFT